MREIDIWGNQISRYKQLNFTEANDLYIKAINTEDEELRKQYMNDLITGTLYVVYNYIKNNNIDKYTSVRIDANDIISAFNEVWIKSIYDGELLNNNTLNSIINLSFMTKVFNSLDINVFQSSYAMETTDWEFKYLLKKYINHMKKGIPEEWSPEMMYAYYRKPVNEEEFYKLTQIFEELYQKLFVNEKTKDDKISEKKIDTFSKVLIDKYVTKRINNNIEDNINYEDEIIKKVDLERFIEDFNEIMENESQINKEAIVKTFGLDGTDPSTYEETAIKDGVSREAVRRRIEHGMTRLRRSRIISKYKNLI